MVTYENLFFILNTKGSKKEIDNAYTHDLTTEWHCKNVPQECTLNQRENDDSSKWTRRSEAIQEFNDENKIESK